MVFFLTLLALLALLIGGVAGVSVLALSALGVLGVLAAVSSVRNIREAARPILDDPRTTEREDVLEEAKRRYAAASEDELISERVDRLGREVAKALEGGDPFDEAHARGRDLERRGRAELDRLSTLPPGADERAYSRARDADRLEAARARDKRERLAAERLRYVQSLQPPLDDPPVWGEGVVGGNGAWWVAMPDHEPGSRVRDVAFRGGPHDGRVERLDPPPFIRVYAGTLDLATAGVVAEYRVAKRLRGPAVFIGYRNLRSGELVGDAAQARGLWQIHRPVGYVGESGEYPSMRATRP